MAYVIAWNCRKRYNDDVATGQAYYRYIFISQTKYLSYKTDVDAKLTAWGVAGCIVTE